MRIPAEPDTYKRRRLADGSEHRVLKNYFTAGDLAALLGPVATDLAVDVGTFYWSARYQVR